MWIDISSLSTCIAMLCSSDTMGNKGAFVTLTDPHLKPNFTTYEAVVSYTTTAPMTHNPTGFPVGEENIVFYNVKV